MHMHIRSTIVRAVALALPVLCAVECRAQVNPQQKLREAQGELQRYLADENEYYAQTRAHYNAAVDQLAENIMGGVVGAEFGETAKNAWRMLAATTQYAQALREEHYGEAKRVAARLALEQILDETLSKAVEGFARKSPLVALGAIGQVPALMDVVSDLLYLHWDRIQREDLDKQREDAERAIEYWRRRAQGETNVPLPPPRPASSDPFVVKMRDLGVESLAADRAVREGVARIAARTRSGYDQTDIQIENLSGRVVAIDFSGSYLIPAAGNSRSQRIGLVSPIGSRSTAQSNKAVVRFVNAFYQTPAPSAWVRFHFVVIAPSASVVATFHSVCLDHSRGIPTVGETFYVSSRPLPPRLQRLLAIAALNGRVPQSQVWNAIEREGISWYDPRNGVALFHAHGYGAFGQGMPGRLQIVDGTIEWNEEGGGDSFTATCSEVREIAQNVLLQSGQSFHIRLATRNVNFIPAGNDHIERITSDLRAACAATKVR